MQGTLKDKTVGALVWNTVDKFLSYIAYAVVGIVLANLLSSDDFGLVGIVMAFAAFVNIFIEGGFTTALIQKKDADETDYSTAFWFNVAASTVMYVVMFFLSPFIADYFEDDRLTLLCRVLFFNFIPVSLCIIQTSMLMREMNVKRIAVINALSLFISGAAALIVAWCGGGVWALVVQTLGISLVKSVLFWSMSRWRPAFVFSSSSFRQVFSVGGFVLLYSFVNTFFLNIYSFIIGKLFSLSQLGYYTQADKWSKMGYTALSQITGYSFFPALAGLQNEPERMRRAFSKMNKTVYYLSLPVFSGLIIVAEPLFHLFFGTKWDASIVMFRLLTVKGLFYVVSGVLMNYINATGRTRTTFRLEVVKDAVSLIAIFMTVRHGIVAIIWGQVAAGIIHFLLLSYMTSRITGYGLLRQASDFFPYLLQTAVIVALLLLLQSFFSGTVLMVVQMFAGFGLYFAMNGILGSNIQREVFSRIPLLKKLYR